MRPLWLVVVPVCHAFVQVRNSGAQGRLTARQSSEEARDRLEALLRQTPVSSVQEDAGLVPVLEARWTYLPGVRDVLRVHAPALTYLMSDVVLRSKERNYVHMLDGEQQVGVMMQVLDTVNTERELYALVHCTHRVRIISFEGEALHRKAYVEPMLDAEEERVSDDDFADAARWAGLDDPLDDFKPTWLRHGGQRRRIHLDDAPPPQGGDVRKVSSCDSDNVAAELESQLWAEIDGFAELVKKSRTSGCYELPPLVAALRHAPSSYPPHRRRLRLSFAVAEVLDLDRGCDRHALLLCTSTADRLALAIDRLARDTKNLAAALALEAIRRGD